MSDPKLQGHTVDGPEGPVTFFKVTEPADKDKDKDSDDLQIISEDIVPPRSKPQKARRSRNRGRHGRGQQMLDLARIKKEKS